MPRVVLINPEIPPNTGNIARTCAATHTELHLVAPLGFELSDRYLKRAGLDYWGYVDLHYHDNLKAFQVEQQQRGGRLIGFSVKGQQSYIHFDFRDDDWLLFGSESAGMPADLMAQCQALLLIPMPEPKIRSLNLSVTVAIALFESYRQLESFEFLSLPRIEASEGE